MHRFISMLRGVNVGGRHVRMEELKRCYARIGADNPRTYIQSGYVIFDTPAGDAESLSRTIEETLAGEPGLHARVIIRTRDEFGKVIARMLFSDTDTNKLHVTFLSEAPLDFPERKIEAARDSSEKFCARGREVYLSCPGGYGRTKLSNGLFEKVLGASATTRNWRTVTALYSMAEA